MKKESPDHSRKYNLSGSSDPPTSPETEESYKQMLYKSKKIDVSYVAKLKIAYQAGSTPSGNPIFVVVGKLFATKKLNMEHVVRFTCSSQWNH